MSGRLDDSRAALALLVALTLAPAERAAAQALSQPLAPAQRPPVERLDAPAQDPTLSPDELRRGASSVVPYKGAANYGAPHPRLKLPKPYPPPRTHAGAPPTRKNPLPQLEPYKTSAVARRKLHAPPLRPGEAPAEVPPTVAVDPTIKAKPKPKIDEHPYDPVGIGIGSLRLSPFVEVGGGYDSNPDRLPSIPGGTNNPIGSSVFRADGGFRLRSDWTRDDLQADLRAGYSDYPDYQKANRWDGAGSLTARYDITRDTSLDLLGRLSLDTQRPGTPAIVSGQPNVVVTNRPIVFSTGVSAGLTQKFNRLELSLRGSFDRTNYGNAFYSDGTTLDLVRTDFNDYGVTGRVAYEIGPDLKPFAEATYDSRIHDSYTDPYGYARDSDGYAARAGAQVRISELLKGEASGGYAERDYKDARLPKLRGPTVDAALIYTATPLTTVTLRAATTLNETTVSSAAGALSRNFTAQLSHDLFRNLTISALGTYFTNEYQGAPIFEHGYSAGVKLEYRLTRSIAFRLSYAHERLNSSAPFSNYTADVIMAGLRFQQ